MNADDKKPVRKSAPKPVEPTVDRTALIDKLSVAINALRAQLRAGETLALPGLLVQMLPAAPGKGDQQLIMDWRAYVVWAEWTGSQWDVIVYQDGQRKA